MIKNYINKDKPKGKFIINIILNATQVNVKCP